MRKDIIISLVVLAGVIALYLSLSLMEEPSAATFPRVVILIMGALALALLTQNLLLRQKQDRPVLQSDRVEDKKTPQKATGFPFKTTIICFVTIVIYFVVMERLGFYLSAFLFFVAATFILGLKDLTVRKGVARICIALVFTAVLSVLFIKLRVVQTPKGILF